MSKSVREIGALVGYNGDKLACGVVQHYDPIGDWCTVDWLVPPQERGTGWHQTHMKAFHLTPLV